MNVDDNKPEAFSDEEIETYVKDYRERLTRHNDAIRERVKRIEAASGDIKTDQTEG